MDSSQKQTSPKQTRGNHLSCSNDNDINQKANHSIQDSNQFYILESFLSIGGYVGQNSSSIGSLSPKKNSMPQQEHYSSPTLDIPVTRCGYSEDVDNLMQKMRELENVMLEFDSNIVDAYDITIQSGMNHVSPEAERKWKEIAEMMATNDLKKMLCACAKAVADNDVWTTEMLMLELRKRVSVSGEPIQRVGAYMVEGLLARLASSGSLIYRDPPSVELFSYMDVFYEACTYFKFGYMSANGVIAKAMKDENIVHIIDFHICHGFQWVTLIQALATRPGGPPQIRITCINDPIFAYGHEYDIDIVGKRLSRVAKSCKVPFKFHVVKCPVPKVQLENLEISPGEAIAVNFAFVLHLVPDESVGVENHRDSLLRLTKSLSPKVVTLVEQDLNVNTALFFPHFVETLNYYNAVFETFDMSLLRKHKERIKIEQHCLAREMVNIIACKRVDRVERYEPIGKWKSRFSMAGFTPYPLSSFVNATIKALVEKYYCDTYTLEERDETLYLGWMNRPLVATCAWR